MMRRKNPILLIEDDQVDVMTIKRAFKELKVMNKIIHAPNGEIALDHLRNASNALPFFILLDINMPIMNGLEFLKILKLDPFLKSIPVIILTTSQDEEDRITSFKQSVAGYMIKPFDFSEFTNMIQTIINYWQTSEFPESSTREK